VRPEDALQAARAAAAAARERGAYADDLSGFAVEPTDRVTTEQLLEWAVIEPDLDLVRSTRRWGGPITAAKRAVVHVLRQYHGQAHAQQTRFNLHAAVRIAELEEQVERLRRERP
jgi:putative AlgH/UPF0301 family transcriptional regulator